MSQNYLTQHAKKCLYYAQFFSHIAYGILVWGNMLNQTQIKKLQNMQNKCFKLVFKQEPTPEKFHAQKILRVQDVLKLGNFKHNHCVQHSHLLVQILTTRQTDNTKKSLVKSHPYKTHHKNSLNLPKNPSSWYKSSFLCHATVEYNTVPAVIKENPTKTVFMSKCKHFLLTGKWLTN